MYRQIGRVVRLVTSTKPLILLLLPFGLTLGFLIACGRSGPIANQHSNTGVTNSSPSTVNSAPGVDTSFKYFNGPQACKFLQNVNGLDLGNYVPYGKVEGYTCSAGERKLTLTCNPDAEVLCNEISYSVNGETQGATSAELSYMGMAANGPSHARDLPVLLDYANQLTKASVGAELSREMKAHISNTRAYLPMKPEPDRATLESQTLKAKLGTGFVTILGRKNELPGGPVFIVFVIAYPDGHWVGK